MGSKVGWTARQRERTRFASIYGGYPAIMVDLVLRRWVGLWRGLLSSPALTLNGWVAFNLPRTVTVLGGSLLTGLGAVHVYVFTTESELPMYFAVYAAVLTIGYSVATGAMIFGRKTPVAQTGWYLGSLMCLGFLGIYLFSRWVALPGLAAVTGRWDFAPGTFAMAFAAAFIALHTTVLSGINVAYPQHHHWRD